MNRKRAAEETFRTKVKFRPPLKHQFTQKELLLDALNTETDNQKWLELQRLQDYERALGMNVVVTFCCLHFVCLSVISQFFRRCLLLLKTILSVINSLPNVLLLLIR